MQNIDSLMQKMTRFTSLGRIVDPRHPSNVFVMIASGVFTLIAAVNAFFVEQVPLGDTAVTALLTGLMVFVAWALGREYDPDLPLTANIAAILAGVTALVWGPNGLLTLALLIGFSRVVNRTTGLPARPLDTLLLLVGAGAVGLLAGEWIGLVVGAIAFLLDASLPNPNRLHYGAAAVSGVLLITVLVMGQIPMPAPSMGFGVSAGVMLVTTLTILAIATLETVEATGDYTNESLSRGRVKFGMFLGLAAALLALWEGQSGVMMHLGLWATLLAVGLTHLRHLRDA